MLRSVDKQKTKRRENSTFEVGGKFHLIVHAWLQVILCKTDLKESTEKYME